MKLAALSSRGAEMKSKTKSSPFSPANLLMLLAIGDLNLQAAANQEALAHSRRSVSVSTSVVSSSHLRPPVAQIVARSLQSEPKLPPSQGDLANQLLSNYPSNQQARTLAGKIHDYMRPRDQIPTIQVLHPRRLADPQVQLARESNQLIARQPSGRAVENVGSTQVAATSGSGLAAGLSKILRGAKNLLSGGFGSIEQRAGGILWFGSNVLAALIPLASLLGLPGALASAGAGTGAGASASSASASPSNGTKKNSLGERFVSSLSNLANSQPLVAAITSGGMSGLQNRVDSLMGWLERSTEHLPNFPRLHPQECFKRSICEAHHEPNKFGALGMTLRLLFPATNGSSLETDNMEFKVINKYRHAASYGHNRRLDAAAAATATAASGSGEGPASQLPLCKERYDDCLVSLLEVGQKLLDFFLT